MIQLIILKESPKKSSSPINIKSDSIYHSKWVKFQRKLIIQNQKPFHFQLFGVALASAAPVAGGEGKYTHGSYDNGKYNPKTRNSGI